MSTDVVYAQIHRRLITSGEWQSILNTMSKKLNELGWLDELKHHSKEVSRSMQPLRFQDLLDELQSHATNSVPSSVEQEVRNLIRSFVEKQTEA